MPSRFPSYSYSPQDRRHFLYPSHVRTHLCLHPYFLRRFLCQGLFLHLYCRSSLRKQYLYLCRTSRRQYRLYNPVQKLCRYSQTPKQVPCFLPFLPSLQDLSAPHHPLHIHHRGELPQDRPYMSLFLLHFRLPNWSRLPYFYCGRLYIRHGFPQPYRRYRQRYFRR